MPSSLPTLLPRSAAEVLGTFILVFFGCGAVHVAVLTGDLGLGQVALVWGVAIMLATFSIGGISGAHINPAITLAFASWGQFPWRDVPAYVLGQLLGAMLAAAALFGLFNPMLEEKERSKQVERGKPGSEITATCYGEYFPNPGKLGDGPGPYSAADHEKHNALLSPAAAFLAEFLGTGILAFVVFALVDGHNPVTPQARLAPVFIGLTVSILISVLGPLTQACFNPARDLGPRLVAFFAGWGEIALPGPRGMGFLTVYIIAPSAGAVTGGGIYTNFVRSWQPDLAEPGKPS